jgi:tellurium resistance protein TerD
MLWNFCRLTQDDRTGAAQGDDEQVVCDLSLVPAQYQKAIVMVTINDAAQRRQNFSMVRNCYVRLFVPRFFSMNGQRLEMQTPLLKFNLAEEYGHNTAVVFCELYREGHVWNFRAVGKGFMGGFQEMMGLLRP